MNQEKENKTITMKNVLFTDLRPISEPTKTLIVSMIRIKIMLIYYKNTPL